MLSRTELPDVKIPPKESKLYILSPQTNDLKVILCSDDEVGNQAIAIGTVEDFKKRDISIKTDNLLNLTDFLLQARILPKSPKFNIHSLYETEKSIEKDDFIKIGSVVRLKSGGPKMTIEKLENNIIHTVFFLDNRDLTKSSFDIALLELIL